MIDLKPPEEEKPTNLFYEQLELETEEMMKKIHKDVKKEFLEELSVQTEVDIKNELHKINKTLKAILREMGKRK